MNSMQVTLRLAQLECIDELMERKHQQFRWHKEGVADVEGITLNTEPRICAMPFGMVTVVLDAKWD